MSYQALYRTWRPQQFSDLVGQAHVRQTLSNAITHSQVAHAYLFCGPRGTGKTSSAKLFAKAVNCERPNGIEPCNTCDACLSITSGFNVDVEEIDAASNRGVDEIRQLRDKVNYAPASLQRKVYIVDEVHMLTTEAFNALLKTLEEPPAHALFILATTEAHKIPSTIVSRCQRFDFRRISPEEIVERLRQVVEHEQWRYEESALWAISDAADGGLRDALGLLEQTAAYGQGNVSAAHVASVIGGVEARDLVRLVDALIQRNLLEAIQLLGGWYENGKEAPRITHDILQVLRDLFIVKLTPSGELKGRPEELFREVAMRCPTEWLLHGVAKMGEVYTQLRYVDQPRLALEAAVLGLVGTAVVPAQHTANVTPAVVGSTSTTSVQPVPASVAAADTMPEQSSASDTRVNSSELSQPAQPSVEPVRGAAGVGRGAPNKKTSAARKREVLEDLMKRSQPEVLKEIQNHWTEILQLIRQKRIQTHAWIMHGSAVLTTENEVVLTFVSRIHRDSVMKPDERLTIESSIAEALGRHLQIFALLQTDWDELSSASENPDDSLASNLAAQAIRVFGKDIVEIREES